ncbi:bifunctional diguanylate cyclase/phosphodiesterase [Hydrogenivirga sp. 128-5-R1-1]|uniref:putative bifunctional diguanylate cyclase/phosphodiesterase n=1 Tax=Hydrogenivirga sp. 128-5-R1-1 TaxID=392423 RepID=UPI00015F18BE|nr:bifunctional diguanylate cyclase/phosphodiesterase [Hydrogenivirga sp. 128-5-R1-1]EDP75512.1 diguanylate cyclase/phosphodiesterase (GGDEF & EAL domains) [Hydrogenivirga sp. 128-5-R1-1]
MLYRSLTGFIFITALAVSALTSLLVFGVIGLILTDLLSHTDTAGVPSAQEIFGEYLWELLLASTLPPIVGALLVTYVLRAKVSKAIRRLREKTTRLSSNPLLEELSREDLGFYELNLLRDSFLRIAQTLRDTTASRDITELELRLTKALVIPSDVPKKWDDTARTVAERLSEVVPLNCMFVGFSGEDGEAVVEFFWFCDRDGSYEEEVKERIRKTLPGLKEIKLRAHSLTAGDKREGELVGVFFRDASVGGVFCSGMFIGERDSARLKVVEGFLPALMSVLGSAKALEEYARNIEYYATRDPLTGLYNQRVFWELLEYEIERAQRRGYSFAVLMIDLDNFKVINDTYGHDFGDKFLREFAKLMRKTFRREDIVARYGGDEFVVILPYASEEEALRSARRFIEELDNFYVEAPDGKPIKATVSIGIALYPQHGESTQELFLTADNIMYRAKAEGKSRVMLPTDTDLTRTAEREGKVGILVLEALEKELVLPAFQPIVDTKTGDVHAYEVLMRIREDGKLVNASRFIHVAERMGIIHRLDHLLMDRALEKVKETDFSGRLFFNLSPRSLVLEDFLKDVIELVEKHDFDPDRMVFEITERDTVKSIDLLKGFAESLKREGFHFAVDDFGSGFASFLYLKHLPVDYVKIEGEFVRSILSSKMDRAFVISIIALAETLEIKTIAEFVESEEVFKAMKGVGVNYVQGYYVGKPRTEL